MKGGEGGEAGAGAGSRACAALVKLVVGMLGREEAFAAAEGALRRRFGRIDFESEVIPFTWSDYYAREMGAGLMRKFVSFGRLIRPERLRGIKLWTVKLEAELSEEGRRRVNLDPGYLDLARLVVATRKDQAHRIALGRGVFAEVTLRFERGRFRPWEWTYADYRTEEYAAALARIRSIYREQVRRASGAG
jgi:hypothetical protein